jgi:hypothetical protein
VPQIRFAEKVLVEKTLLGDKLVSIEAKINPPTLSLKMT